MQDFGLWGHIFRGFCVFNDGQRFTRKCSVTAVPRFSMQPVKSTVILLFCGVRSDSSHQLTLLDSRRGGWLLNSLLKGTPVCFEHDEGRLWQEIGRFPLQNKTFPLGKILSLFCLRYLNARLQTQSKPINSILFINITIKHYYITILYSNKE